MSRLITLEEEMFLSVLLKNHYQSDNPYQKILNDEFNNQAIIKFLEYFKNTDEIDKSNHVKNIERIFSGDITNENCSSELGISQKTLFRYKQKYLHIFKKYLNSIS